MGKALKFVLAYVFASLCFSLILGGFGVSHPHVAYSKSLLVEILISPLMPPMALLGLTAHILENPNGPFYVWVWLGACAAFVLPFFGAIALINRQSNRRMEMQDGNRH